MPPRRTSEAPKRVRKIADEKTPLPTEDNNVPVSREAAAWQDIRGTWRPLYGSFFEQGVSVEWHDFTIGKDMDWARSFHPGSLEICLNFSGSARLHDGEAVRELPAVSLAIYTTRNQAPGATRLSGSWHRFLTIEVARSFCGPNARGSWSCSRRPCAASFRKVCNARPTWRCGR